MSDTWNLIILDAAPPVKELGCLAAGDLDGDGHVEVVTGGDGGLLWYRPDTFEQGLIAEGHYAVGLTLEDVDGDGLMEVVTTREDAETSAWTILWFDSEQDLSRPWSAHVIDPTCNGSAHDMLFFDVDGDGVRELVANAAYCAVPGVFIYKAGADATAPWDKYTVSTGIFSEGLGAADLDGNGRFEIVHGPDWFKPPAQGPLAGPWKRTVYAPSFREMCRTALVDVTGNGRKDVVIVESEYADGRMAWFENRLAEDPENPWIMHEIGEAAGFPWNFAHSLDARRDMDSDEVHVFVAEMAAGGWGQPYNWDARVTEFVTTDGGETWHEERIDTGVGTHQATMVDLDGDGVLEVAGKEWGQARTLPRVHFWRQVETPSPLTRVRHRLLDRDKPYTGTDILAADVDGGGQPDVVCGAWWYRNPTWERHQIPGVYQVHNVYDLDGDGRDEFIATKKSTDAKPGNWYSGLSSELCWIKPLDPVAGLWEEHPIGTGDGDWPHGTLMGPFLPGGKLALMVGYHSAEGRGDLPQMFEVPDDPRERPWPKRVLAEIPYGEEFVAHDVSGNGQLDIVAGRWWLENEDGAFRPHKVVEGEDFDNVARVRVADVNGSGHPDILVVEEGLDYAETRQAFFVRIAWLENPGDPCTAPWSVHVIDKMRSPHSLDVADLDGDGELEVIVGEHDPFKPYRSRSRLCVYKKADPQGRAWAQYVLDDRFEHHDGAKVFEMSPGQPCIISHGWVDSRYVHLWEFV